MAMRPGFSKQVANVLQQVIAIEPTDPPAKIHYHFDYRGDGSPQQQQAARNMDLVLKYYLRPDGPDARDGNPKAQAAGVQGEPSPAEQVLP